MPRASAGLPREFILSPFDVDDEAVILSGMSSREVQDIDGSNSGFVQRSKSATRDPRLALLPDEHALAKALGRSPTKLYECRCLTHDVQRDGAKKLPLRAFAPDPANSDGRDRFCLRCRRRLNAERREAKAKKEGRTMRRRKRKDDPATASS